MSVNQTSAQDSNEGFETLIDTRSPAGPETAATPEIAAETAGRKAARKAKTAMETVKAKTNLALMTVATAGALAVGSPTGAKGLESPYELMAGNGGAELVLKEDPARNEEILGLLTKFKKIEALERLPKLSITQRERVAWYYKIAKTSGINDRVLSSGVSGVINGFAEIADVRAFVEEYKSTGKARKEVPLPYAHFKGASEKFTGAVEFLALELEGSKKLDDQINTILIILTQDAEKRTQDAEKRTQDAEKRTIELHKKIEFLDALLKGMK